MPAHEHQGSASQSTKQKQPRMVRRGIPLAVAIAWNGPLLVVLYYAFIDSISERTMNLLMAAWASMIPVCCILVAHVPALQRLIFVPDVEIATMRPKLWIVSILWFLIVAFWIQSELSRI
jgi:hypothetical protein